MPKPTDKQRVSIWQKRVNRANDVYDRWADRFQCDLGEKYYLGEQYQAQPSEVQKQSYVINLFFPSIETRKPSMLFYHPQVKVEPRPAHADDPGTSVVERAKLQQDTVNTFIGDPRLEFIEETQLALFESHFRFGVVEVGYTGDFIDNPNAGKPVLKEDSEEPLLKANGETVLQPEKQIRSEQLYVKRIPATNWRVSANAANSTARNDWCGYFEWNYPEDIKRNSRYKNTSSLKPTGSMLEDIEVSNDDPDKEQKRRGMVKLWKIWDNRSMTRYCWLEGHEKFLLDEDFKFLPFSDIRLHERLDEWYPLPPVFNWMHPQNEVNETREMQRMHRRRAQRRYGHTPNVDSAELMKLESGGDMCHVELPQPEALWPIQDAPLDGAIFRDSEQSKVDFREVSGISAEARAVAESDTATQANLIELHSKIRETYARVQVARWLAKIARLMLMNIKEYMALPFWIKRNVDPFSPSIAEEATRVALLWEQIKAIDLGDLNCDISVSVESLSPIAEDIERDKWLQALQLVANPAIMPLLASSEFMLRKTLGYFNVKSEREIAEVKKTMQVLMLMQQMAAQAKGQTAPGQGQTASPGPTPTNSDTQIQLEQQMPQEAVVQ